MAIVTATVDWATYTLGDFTVQNNVWNKGDRVNGTDFTQSISYDDQDLSHDLSFAWDWGDFAGDVLAYPEIQVGYKPAGQSGSDTLTTKISDLSSFTVTHDISIGGPDTDQFNVAYDMWLSGKPRSNFDSVTAEVMVWMHSAPALEDFFPSQRVGIYKQDGMQFNIYAAKNVHDISYNTDHGWNYIALVPKIDYLSTTLDMRDVLYELIKLGLVKDKSYVNGYELGAEVGGGAGSIDINSLSFNFGTYGADNTANTLDGSEKRDHLFGLGGNDTISGARGNDFLSGGKGSDTLTGGLGADIFHLDTLNGTDRLVDFNARFDDIELDAHAFHGLKKGGLAKNAFDIGKRFDADDRILYNNKTGQLYFDADGLGHKDDPHLIAILGNHAGLSYKDFHIV